VDLEKRKPSGNICFIYLCPVHLTPISFAQTIIVWYDRKEEHEFEGMWEEEVVI
jgi:hypothetical protein